MHIIKVQNLLTVNLKLIIFKFSSTPTIQQRHSQRSDIYIMICLIKIIIITYKISHKLALSVTNQG